MKLSLLIASTCAAAAFLAAQNPAPAAKPPSLFPQQPAASAAPAAPAVPIPPDTVVVTVNGKGYTAKEMDDLLSALPPQSKATVMKSPEQLLPRLFMMNALAEEGKKKNLDQTSPAKEQIESKQRQYLAQILVQDENTHIRVTDAEEQAYYEAHKDMYQSAKISAIYVAFTPNAKPDKDGKMPRTEPEAKTKAEDLVKQLRAGGDFAKLATEQSDDKDSAKKGGEYATIKRGDNYPQPIKDAIFKLKDNEISDPVRQAAGYYIFKVTEHVQQEYKDVQSGLFEKVKEEKFKEWFQGVQKAMTPKIDTPEYFKGPAPTVGTSSTIATLPVPVSPETVVVTVEGKGYTAKQMDEYMKLLPPQGRPAMKQNPERGLTDLFMILHLSEEARKRKLDQEPPHKETLELMSREGLAQAYATDRNNSEVVTPADEEAYYKEHTMEFESAKVSAILVSFSANPKPAADGKTPRSEAEAKAKAEDLVKQLRDGADFAKLALENSDDKATGAKGGTYATIKRNGPFPQATKDVVFSLKPGDVSDPVRQPSGFYIFKTTSKETQPFAEAAPAIGTKMKQEKYNEWMAGLQKQYTPKIEKPEYFKK
jgi:parvulin-like peptidyl-prolyl isomerase